MNNIKEIFENLFDRSKIVIAAHESQNVILIWWYAPKENQLEYFKDASGHNDVRFEVVKNDSLYKWGVKGRVFKYQNKIILMVYRSGLNKVELNEDELLRLINKIETEIKVNIDYTINDHGENLLERKNIKQKEIYKYI
jgi:hypothetical protein